MLWAFDLQRKVGANITTLPDMAIPKSKIDWKPTQAATFLYLSGVVL